MQLYYYSWQVAVYAAMRVLHRQVGFDLVHHVTFAKYWMPSLLANLPVPFVWGPVGGADSAPAAFWGRFSMRGKTYEALRDAGCWLGEHDPLVRITARRSAVALAKTALTADRLRRLGVRDVRIVPGEALSAAEINRLAEYPLFKDGGPNLSAIVKGGHFHKNAL